MGPGELVTLPKGIPHVFGNLSDSPVRAIGIISPVGSKDPFVSKRPISMASKARQIPLAFRTSRSGTG